uniref:Protein kinase domain-containing protein n=1 Tax=Oryza punctata TaxID=4537 RepID=A0A0E0JWG6_ORYPU
MPPPPLTPLCSSCFFLLLLLLVLSCALPANGRTHRSPVAAAAASPSPGPGPSPSPATPPVVPPAPAPATGGGGGGGGIVSSNGSLAVTPATAVAAAAAGVAPSPPLGAVAVMEQRQHHHFRKELIIAIGLASVAGMAIAATVLYACILCRHSRRAHDSKNIRSSSDTARVALVPMLNKFNSMKTNKKGLVAMMEYNTLETATGKFSESNLLGAGGFGCVYKASFEGGLVAAVKRFGRGGQECEKEFEVVINELDLLGSIRHLNIVSLLGFCIHEENRFIVYELMENGSLEAQLHGPSHGSALSWHIRMKIALDTARGLEYLHEHCNPPVIHRDLKSSNILLDSDFNAKISDFGLAVTSGNHSKGSLKLSGTLGYVAPEYLLDGKLTEKSDVYAFGVVLLELLLGRRPVEKTAQSQCQSIVTWAMPQLTDRSKLPNIIDPMIKNTMDLKHLYQVAAVAVLCVQPEPSYRPLITDVLHSLIPLVPMELGGTLRISPESPCATRKQSPC